MIYKMKLWQKIFVSSFFISILLLGFCGIFTTVSAHRLNLEKEYTFTKQLTNQIVCTLTENLQTEAKSINHAGDLLDQIQKKTVPPYIFIQLKDGKKLIYDGLGKAPEPLRYDFGYKITMGNVYTQTIQDSNHLFIEKQFPFSGKMYTLVLINNLEQIYDMCNTQLKTLFLLCGILSLVSALVMIIISFLITIPIKRMNEAVAVVTSNYYSYRLPVTSADELSELSGNFNTMCEAIENNIKNYKLAIDNFTHEVKSPLTSIIGYAEILQSPQCDEQTRKEAVNYILNEGKRLNSLVRKIMGFLVIETDQLDKKRILVADMVHMACMSVQMKADMKNIKIKHDISDKIYMYGDEELLVTSVVNFLDNAIKASKERSKILIEVSHQDFALSELIIRDFGSGIPQQELNKITELFYMVDKARSRTHDGVGLGLSICKAIIQAHKGQLFIESQEEKGTTMHIQFPYLGYQRMEKATLDLFSST